MASTTIAAVGLIMIALLASCSSGRFSPEADRQPPPPPPFVPYEATPGDAARVQSAADNIRASAYNPAPSFTPSVSPYPQKSGYPAAITINNQTTCKLGFYLKGPSPRQIGVLPSQSETINVSEGQYAVAVDTRLCGANISPLYREDVFSAGHAYIFTVSQNNIAGHKGGGKFIVQNNTGADIRVKLADLDRTLGGGVTEIPMTAGLYTATVSARCGTKTDSFTITNGSGYEASYWCSGGSIEVRQSRPSGGIGYFDVTNSTGGTLTIAVGGQSYHIKPGSLSIELAPGKYTATVSARCGSKSVSLDITQGSRHEGAYSCVTR